MFGQKHGMEQEHSNAAACLGSRPDPHSLRALIEAGLSDARCGERYGLSKYAIRRLRRRWGIAARLNRSAAPTAQIDPFALRWRSGDLSDDQITQLYGRRVYGRRLVPR